MPEVATTRVRGCDAVCTRKAAAPCNHPATTLHRHASQARYRNRFWREPDGSVLLSWFPGRGHTVTGPAVTALLGGMPLLLFCRRAPAHEYLLCGRLAPVALALAEGAEAEAGGTEATVRAALWTTATTGEAPGQASQAAHVVFRLLDADALQHSQAPGEMGEGEEDALSQVLGGRAVDVERPKHYVAETTIGPEHGASVMAT